jgi:hypothetical protein
VNDDDEQLAFAMLRSAPEWGDFPLRLLERGADTFVMSQPAVFFSLSLYYNRSPRTLKALVEYVSRVDW